MSGFPVRNVLVNFPPRVNILSPSVSRSSHAGDPSRGIPLLHSSNEASIQLVPEPALLSWVTEAARDAGRTLHAHLVRLKGDVGELSAETNFYETATRVRPGFASILAQTGAMNAEALFTKSAGSTTLWSLPLDCKPELLVRANVDPATCLYRPGWNGEIKSAATATALNQAVTYATMDMVRVFFPASAVSPASAPRRFFSSPPLAFALVAYPHVGYVIALEWIGAVLVSVVSEPFILGSIQHKAAIAALPDVKYDPPVDLSSTDPKDWKSPLPPGPGGDTEPAKVSWRVTDGGRFQKLLRYDAYDAAQFARMARVYSRLAAIHAALKEGEGEGGDERASAHVVTDARLLYGAHEVLVDMAAVPEAKECSDDDLRSNLTVRKAVAQAAVWLAQRGIIYTDFRGPNVLMAGEGASAGGGEGRVICLVDFDDSILAEKESVTTWVDFKRELQRYLGLSGAVGGAAWLLVNEEGGPAGLRELADEIKGAFDALHSAD